MSIDLAMLAAWNNACSVDTLAGFGGVAPAPLGQPNTAMLARTSGGPTISLVICCDGSDDGRLRATLASLAGNDLSAIQAVLVAPGNSAGQTAELVRASGLTDKVEIYSHSCDNLASLQQSALTYVAGDFVAFLSPGDILADDSLGLLKSVIAGDTALAILYSDEDWLDADGRLVRPRLKTGWDPDAHLGRDQFGRLCLLRRESVMAVGGILPQTEPAQEYDLNCRVAFAVAPTAIRHIPAILCHRMVPATMGPSQSEELDRYYHAARIAAQRAAESLCGAAVSVSPSPRAAFINRIHWPVPDPRPLVSILIPTRDRADLLRNCIAGLQTRTNYRSFEALILDNDSVEPETFRLFEELRENPQFRVVSIPGQFNFSKINNAGARSAHGEILLFLNNDIEIIAEDWLDEIVANVVRPDVGCVGARLLYGDRTIQHAGIVFKPGPLAMHVFRRRGEADVGFDAHLAGTRTYLAVTAACLAVRRSLFERVNGFDELGLKVSFQDVDLCLKVDALGYRNVCTPFEPLFHLEGATRSGPATAEREQRERSELTCLVRRWRDRFADDPFAHPRIELDWERGERLGQALPNAVLHDLLR